MSESSIQTYTGQMVDIYNPDPSQFSILDIAHSLSMQCRFNGHITRFYSVAEHSVRAAKLVGDWGRPELVLGALMHDASEAYLSDIPRPIKRKFDAYIPLEDELMMAISKKFGFDWPMPDIIKKVDDILLITERRDLMLASEAWREWGVNETPMEEIIEPWDSAYAEHQFLKLYGQTMQKHVERENR
jgi:hypothetical protein